MRTAHGWLMLFVLLGIARPTLHGAEGKHAEQAQRILQAHCYRCHGQEGSNEGGLNYVLDAKQLVARRKIIPGNAEQSKFFKRLVHPDDPMPPADVQKRLTNEEIDTLKQWINDGATPIAVAEARVPITATAVVQAMVRDVQGIAADDRAQRRYLVLSHLWNAGLGSDEIESYRHGIAKLLNSLSWAKTIAVPVAIDDAKTILRIDLRHYQWDARSWQLLVEQYPYALAEESPTAGQLRRLTGCETPALRGDWFVATASRPPLYHDVLQLPGHERELEKLLHLDPVENIRQERVVRAGFNSSGVSRNNRLIERHDSRFGMYWRSYDFAGNSNRQNLFAFPLGPGKGRSTFEHDGGEVIFSLPNGLHAYFLSDHEGRRIDKGPTAIVSDPRRPDRAVENGLSCMSCHARGIIEKNDQIRPHVLKNPKAFDARTAETVLNLYPPQDALLTPMRADAKRFMEAVSRTGLAPSRTEPITALALRYEAEMPLELVAAETGLTPRELLQGLDRSPLLGKLFGPLRIEGGTIQRQVYIDCFPELVETFRLGAYQASSHVRGDRLLRQGITHVEQRDWTNAQRQLEAALKADPQRAAAWAAKGDLHRHQGQWSAALLAYNQAIRLDARVSAVFNNRGLVHQKQAAWDAALADFTAALRLDPFATATLYNRGVAHFQNGSTEAAIADYTEALKLDPRLTRALNNRGYAYLEQEDYQRAEADLDQAIKFDPPFAIAYGNRGLLHLRQERYDAALRDLNEAIRLDPAFAHAYLHRAEVHTKQGRQQLAEQDTKKAYTLNPKLKNAD